MANAVEIVKRAAVEAVEAGKPVQVTIGTVLSTSPLKIQSEQKAIYTSKMLILTRNVTDFEVDMTVNDTALRRNTFKVHNALRNGEKVLLLRVQQGKKFVVIDRMKEA